MTNMTDIFNDPSYKLYIEGRTELEDGEYSTIRVGAGGHIYMVNNIVENNEFMLQTADASRTILYKKNHPKP